MTTPRAADNEPARDPTRCPLCGQSNACTLAAGNTTEPCWCTTVDVPRAVLDRLAPEDRGVACVCAACVNGGGEQM